MSQELFVALLGTGVSLLIAFRHSHGWPKGLAVVLTVLHVLLVLIAADLVRIKVNGALSFLYPTVLAGWVALAAGAKDNLNNRLAAVVAGSLLVVTLTQLRLLSDSLLKQIFG